ncbi:MAG: hypothetical protein R3B95_20630 [Nitrospirales bacterium]
MASQQASGKGGLEYSSDFDRLAANEGAQADNNALEIIETVYK